MPPLPSTSSRRYWPTTMPTRLAGSSSEAPPRAASEVPQVAQNWTLPGQFVWHAGQALICPQDTTPPAGSTLGDGAQQVLERDRLGEVEVEAGLATADAVLLQAVSGEGHQPERLGDQIPQAPRQLVAVHHREADVEHRHLGGLARGEGEGLGAVVGHGDLVPLETQRVG